MPRHSQPGTHTFVTLEISPAAFNEIRDLLIAAEYHHVFVEDSINGPIDMHGIGLVKGPEPEHPLALNDGPADGSSHWDAGV